MPLPRADSEAPPAYDTDHIGPNNDSYRNSSSNGTFVNDNEGAGFGQRRVSKATLLRNPLAGMTREEVLADVDAFVESKGLTEHREDFRKGALVAQANNTPGGFEKIEMLSEDEKAVLRKEETSRWHQPFALYFLCTLCAGSAIVQGMDQTTVNGAQEFYFREFEIENVWMQGLTNGAPYLCSAVIGCWTSPILNKYTGRRGTIFISCAISTITGFWMACTTSLGNFLAARFMLGFAVGAKSSTTPVYSAESTPKNIRGALTMMWQMWTAFGIALGFIVCVAFQKVTIIGGPNSPWRWMMASTSIPPLVVMLQVYLCPESPRWYMERGRFDKAFRSVRKLRFSPVQATRDMYYAYKLLEIERGEREGRNLLKEFFTVRRNRRAAQSAWFCMFMQQFCGVNVIAYYSTSIFTDANYSLSEALLVSMGGGIINFLFAIPAIYTIDTFGRRNLLLVTFPLMAACLFFTGGVFQLPDQPRDPKIGTITLGLYLFMAVYSPGLGPVPFTYSAEAFPLHIRDIGMASSTAITWGFNFIISLTWPALRDAFSNTGAFGWYGAWNIFGWIFCYFLLPETKNLTLEELDNVFGVSNREHASYYWRKLPWYLNKYILRKDVAPFPPLYEFAANDGHYPHEKPDTSHIEGNSAVGGTQDKELIPGPR
ncbi:myo-inositol transport ITR1 [Fusarium phyllophilum]|uniref:Myo-inositol transport ITR1 n=1 Tax=Fusarium phyllophilum TaxID=47803 RepID=A0A8H5MZ38_9HYPO|nr:myo-inositol transport ITR1 [Fusarium phyllophilum]